MAAKSRIKVPIYLLKTRSTPTDSYETVLSQPHSRYALEPRFIPVLEHRLIDKSLELLRNLVVQGSFVQTLSANKYGGIIFTSQRAVDAFASVLGSLRSESIDLADLLTSQLTFYVVGPATSRAVQALGLPCRVAGEHTGNGDALAQFILEDFTPESGSFTNTQDQTAELLTDAQAQANDFPTGERASAQLRKKLLFLVGETRRDIIPRTLKSHSIVVDEMTVYATVEASTFASEFASALHQDSNNDSENTSSSSSQGNVNTSSSKTSSVSKGTSNVAKSTSQNQAKGQPKSRAKRNPNHAKWIVVFSPQGSKAMLSTLNLLDPFTGRVKEGYQTRNERAWQRIHSAGLAACFGDDSFLSPNDEDDSLLSTDQDSRRSDAPNSSGPAHLRSGTTDEDGDASSEIEDENGNENENDNEDEDEHAYSGSGGEEEKAYIATIGPTTRTYLAREFDFEADVCAAKPTPEAVRQGIVSFLEGI